MPSVGLSAADEETSAASPHRPSPLGPLFDRGFDKTSTKAASMQLNFPDIDQGNVTESRQRRGESTQCATLFRHRGPVKQQVGREHNERFNKPF